MKRAFRLISYPRKQILFRQGIPVVFVYCFLLPYQMQFLQLDDPMMIARQIFRSSQLLLAFITLWPLFCFFLPIYQPRIRETLQALRHPVVSCVLELMAVEQVICIPLYIWMFLILPNYRMIIWILFFQSFCLSMTFAALLYLLRSPIINITVGLLYICISIPLADTNIPVLLRPGSLLDGFGMDYWIEHSLIQIVFIVLMMLYHRFYRASRFS